MPRNPKPLLHPSAGIACALLLAGSLLIAGAMPAPAQEGEPPSLEPPAVEHHLHIRTAEAGRLFDEEAEARTAEHALAALDGAGIERALVLSVAYQFDSPLTEVEDPAPKVRRENDWVAEQVATAPERLIGACSVNPLADYSLAEVERCAADRRLSAIKLHLANSGVDLENEEHVEALGTLFERLDQLGLPAVVHLRGREEGYGAEDAIIFVDRVLSKAPDLPVQIAHMGGWGGYDAATDEAMAVFSEAMADGRLDPDLVSFDLAAVVFRPEAAGDDKELEAAVREGNRLLAERIRDIGPERVVYGTDWPAWPPVPDPSTGIDLNIRLISIALPLEESEIERVLSNVGSVVRSIR